MKSKSLYLFIFLTQTYCSFSQQVNWKPAGDRITTQWTQQVDPAHPLPDYPRPQMVRSNNWVNLNGLWDFSILPKAEENIPASFSGRILVPYAVESSLSGVGKTVGKDSVLWYSRLALMRYEGFIGTMEDMVRKGLSAAVYTQTTDVEGEVNGLMTYDRKVFKMPVDRLKQLHAKLYNPSLVTLQ